MRATKFALKHIENTPGRGAVINIASIAGRSTGKNNAPCQYPYSPSISISININIFISIYICIHILFLYLYI